MAAVALAGLAACGGGGGSSGDPIDAGPGFPSAAPITASNYEGVARQTLDAANYMGDASGLVTGAQLAPGAQALLRFGHLQALRLGSLLARTPQLATGATSTSTLQCSGGGSITVSITDLNGNGEVDAGDSGAFTASSCNEAGATISGNMSVAFSAVSGNLEGDVFSATVVISVQNLVASAAGGSATGNGSFTLAMSSTSATAQTLDLQVPLLTLNGNLGGTIDTMTLQDYHLVSSRSVVSGRGRTTTTISGGLASTAVAGGLVTLSTVQPLVQFDGDAHASSGQLLATGASSSKMRLTVQSASSVLLELDADGNGSYETSTTRTWAELV